jgi:di/tricarboxylate transporter
MPKTVIQARDAILILGSKDQLAHLSETQLLTQMPPLDEDGWQKLMHSAGLAEIMLAPESKLIGHSFEDLKFRSRYQVTVLAVRRRGEALVEHLDDLKLDFGDTLLITAPWEHILSLQAERQNFVVLSLPDEYRDIAPARNKAPWAIFILTAMVAAMALGLLPTVTTAMIAAVVMIAAGCIRLDTIYRVIGWQAVVLVAGILPLATALQTSGADRYISVGLVALLGPLGPYGMLAVIFLCTAVTGFFLSNTATAVLIAPIAIDTAITIGASPHAFAMTVAIACSAAYVTPVSSPVNMLVYEPGGYHFLDFVKVGLPLLLLTMLVSILMASALY